MAGVVSEGWVCTSIHHSVEVGVVAFVHGVTADFTAVLVPGVGLVAPIQPGLQFLIAGAGGESGEQPQGRREKEEATDGGIPILIFHGKALQNGCRAGKKRTEPFRVGNPTDQSPDERRLPFPGNVGRWRDR